MKSEDKLLAVAVKIENELQVLQHLHPHFIAEFDSSISDSCLFHMPTIVFEDVLGEESASLCIKIFGAASVQVMARLGVDHKDDVIKGEESLAIIDCITQRLEKIIERQLWDSYPTMPLFIRPRP